MMRTPDADGWGATATAAAAAAAAAHAGVEPRADASGRSGKGAGAGAGGSFAFYDDDDDDDDDSPGSRVVDPADALFEQRASHLRFLRALELRDEAERQARRREEEEEQTMTMTTTKKEAITVLSSGHRVLAYDSFLDNQRYYDDLKHVDCHFIYYERSNLIIEQDKTLGKGGLCWDAAFILAEYLVATMKTSTTTRIIELGSGTGLCGLMLAKSLLMTKKTPDCQFTVTDLPELLPLLERNLNRNFATGRRDAILDEYFAITTGARTLEMPPSSSGSTDDDDEEGKNKASNCNRLCVSASVLKWGDRRAEKLHGSFDIVIGSDVVASLYDPIELARCIHRLSRNQSSRVFVSFKERLSTLHRQFESEMEALYETIEIVEPRNKDGTWISRNRNPQVKILVATGKKMLG